MVVIDPEKKSRIAILLGAPFTAQNFERAGIPYLSKYFEVIVFDCTELLGRNTDNIKSQRIYWHNFLAIKSEMDLAVQIEKHRLHYVIDFTWFKVVTPSVFQILVENGVKFVVPKTGSIPIVKIGMRVKNMLGLIFKKKSRSALIDSENNELEVCKTTTSGRVNKLFSKIQVRVQKILITKKLLKDINAMPEYICLLAGNKSLDRITRKGNPIIWIGSHDYHTFKKAKSELALNMNSQVSKPFFLFIDDNLPMAEDWALLGITPPVTGALYYPALNTFFEKIEAIYHMPVKIAGHPNSVADESYQSNMGGRSVIFGDTATLILKASIILVHGSTAVSFAVLARKKIISLTSQELDRAPYGLYVRTMSNALGSPLVFIDRSNNKKNDLAKLTVDEIKYSLYEANYLCNDLCTEVEPWGALIDYISSSSQIVDHL